MADVRLGYEVGTGKEVRVPIAHMVVTGQTQLSGKTTTLEGLVHRATGMRALAFVTKRGEGAFDRVAFTARAEATGEGRLVAGWHRRVHLVRPYFRERADWKFVSAILEAETQERMKFERAWIMRATRGARALADVRRNVNKFQAKSKRSMDQDIYMQLGEYLDAVLPVLARIDFAPAVELRDGLNVVHLDNLPVQVQGLVIASMLQWVHERERDVTVILPESWKYIPQGRNSPVKMAAVSLAREGAGIGNLLWLDCQDLAGAEKEIVRQASVYVMGVQREVNELKRALAHIPAGIKKPRADDVARLQRGQFFACWGDHAVKTYVQPAWMDDETARETARHGLEAVAKPQGRAIAEVIMGPGLADEAERIPPRPWPEPDPRVARALAHQILNGLEEEDEMKPEEMKQLAAMIGESVGERFDALGDLVVSHVDRLVDGKNGTRPPPAAATVETQQERRRITRDEDPVGVLDEDAVIDRVIDRIAERRPALLRVLLERPEIQVETVKRGEITADARSLRGRLALLIADGAFDGEGLNGRAATRELMVNGAKVAHPAVYAELDALEEMGFLRVRVTEKGERRYIAVSEAKADITSK